MTERSPEIDAFLAQSGWAGAFREPLAGDASRRHYERVALNGRTAVLMDAPIGEDLGRYIAIARHLTGLGYSAPQIYSEDRANRLLLLEDLGNARYGRILDERAADLAPESLIAPAVDLLADLHRHPAPPDVTVIDEPYLAREAALFIEWWLAKRLNRSDLDELQGAYDEAWRTVRPCALAGPFALALRDFHADNLMWLPERGDAERANGIQRVGVLDFQDAVAAPVAYDLVSLLQDARRDIPADLAEAMIRRYLSAFPTLDDEAFRTSYAALGAHRNLRIVGVFSRLALRDGKKDYLRHLPRVWRLVEENLTHPALASLNAWLDHIAPADTRQA